jgi:hypothetical protein
VAIHSHQKDHLRRRRESLGHLKLHLDDLVDLVEEWEHWCGSVTISVGDGVTADLVEDLVDATKFEISHLVIQTEDPTVAISLRRHKAELSYISDAQDLTTINNFRASLKPFKLHTPYYRLRSFWWLVYLLFTSTTVLTVALVNDWQTPFWPLAIPYSAMAILLVYFFYSYGKMRRRSSTRILRGKPISKKWRRAKSLAYWVFPPVALALGILLGNLMHSK